MGKFKQLEIESQCTGIPVEELINREIAQAREEDINTEEQIESVYGNAINFMPNSAEEFLDRAKDVMARRARLRDAEDGERSMKACVEAFNAMYDTDLSITQGYVFMLMLKLSRAKNGNFNFDDWVDCTAYASLAGEEASKKS